MAILSHKSKKRKIKHKGYLARCRLYMEDHGWDGMFDLADGYMVIIIPAKKDFKELRTRTPHNDPKMRFDAIRFIASYAHGKPKETLDVSSKGRSFADMARELMRQ